MTETFGDQPNNLQSQFELTDPQLVSLLGMMLEYNPVLRPTAKQLISCPIFDKIRNLNLER